MTRHCNSDTKNLTMRKNKLLTKYAGLDIFGNVCYVSGAQSFFCFANFSSHLFQNFTESVVKEQCCHFFLIFVCTLERKKKISLKGKKYFCLWMAKQIRYNSDFCETVLQTKGSNVNNDKFLSNNKSQTHAQRNCCITKK